MASDLNFAVVKEFDPKYHNGMVNENHLGYLYGTNPQKASELSTKLFQAMTNVVDLYDYLDMYPTKKYKSDEELYWDVVVGNERNIPLIECRINGTAITAASQVGIGGSIFEMVFPEDYFFDTNIIFGDHYQYQMRVLEDPTPIEGNFVYKCRFISGDNEAYIPYSELTPGKKFSKLFSGVESSMSKKGGKMNFSSPFRLKNYFTTLRMEDFVPGGMERKSLALAAYDQKTGKTFYFWNDYREFQFELAFRRERAYALYWSMLNTTNEGKSTEVGKSGYKLIQGAGLRQQLEGSGVDFYPTEDFDIDWLTNNLLDLSVNKLDTDMRKFVLRTGERGMVQFSKSLQDYASLYTPLNDTTRVALKGNILTYKGQFLEFMGPNGIVVKLEHDPFKDNTVHNKIMHPNGGTAESYVYDILDVGTSGGDPNIFKVSVEGHEDIRAYESGIGSPWNLQGNNMISTPVHGWKEYRMWKGGIIVKDPTRCKIMKPQILSL